ncbi:MAG: molybdopterin-containing oxidoreductase family protein, partial [Thermodesulfobacteriota bacterium]
EHLFIQPDTDCFFLLSLLWVLIERDRVDPHWIQEDPKGYETLKEVVRKWSPERTEAITGIPAEKVVDIAVRLSGARPAASYGSVGINLGRNGTLAYWLLLVLNLLAGPVDRPGGSLLCKGVVDMDRLYRLSGLGRSRKRSVKGDFLPVMGTYPAALLADEILSGQAGRVRALVVVAGNPLLSLPNELHLKEALEKLDLLVCLDLYKNETGVFAHYLLPTTDFLEREDLNLSHAALQIRRYAARTPAVVRPDGEQREEWDILEDLCRRMNRPLWGRTVEAAVGAVDRVRGSTQKIVFGGNALSPPVQNPEASSAFPGRIIRLLLRLLGETDFPSLEGSPHGILLKPHALGRLRRKKRWPWMHPAVRLAPPDLVREASKLEGFLTVRDAEKGEFLLIGKRERHTHNTWMHNVDALLRGEDTNYMFMHPEDAQRKGIREGEWVLVKNSEGAQVQVPCRLTPDLKRGVVALPHGWGHRYASGWRRARKRPGVNVNRLASDAVWKLEALAGMAWMNGIPVDVRKAKRPGRKKRTEGGTEGDRI